MPCKQAKRLLHQLQKPKLRRITTYSLYKPKPKNNLLIRIILRFLPKVVGLPQKYLVIP
jgi:hypothetical protein